MDNGVDHEMSEGGAGLNMMRTPAVNNRLISGGGDQLEAGEEMV